MMQLTGGIRMATVVAACAVAFLLIASRPALAQAVATVRQNTVITSRTLEFDYKRYMATFETDVEVVDPQLRVKSDRLTLLFEEGGQVKSVTASGAVNLSHEQSRGVCRKAIYLAREGEVILMGDVVLRNGDRIGMCQKAEYSIRTGQVKMSGDASLKRPADTVRANEIVFQLENGDIESVKASGNVRMEHEDAGNGPAIGLPGLTGGGP